MNIYCYLQVRLVDVDRCVASFINKVETVSLIQKTLVSEDTSFLTLRRRTIKSCVQLISTRVKYLVILHFGFGKAKAFITWTVLFHSSSKVRKDLLRVQVRRLCGHRRLLRISTVTLFLAVILASKKQTLRCSICCAAQASSTVQLGVSKYHCSKELLSSHLFVIALLF